MAIDLALFQPEIAQNVGTLLRLAACFGTRVHIIHPTAFGFSEKGLRRAGLDYVGQADFVEHESHAAFEAWRGSTGRRLVLLTTRAPLSAYDETYRADDILMVGRESAGVPDGVAALADVRVRIPMREGMRSLNVAIAAALVLGEAQRQTGAFKDLT